MAELYRSDIVDVDIGKSLLRTYAGIVLATGDSNANRFGARVNRAGDPVDISGCAVTGYFIRPNMDTVVINGKVEGSTVYVDLPDACYTNDGSFSLAIKISGSGIRNTIRVIDGCIRLAQTDNLVDPGEAIPSLDDLFAQIAAMEAATAEANSAADDARAAAAENETRTNDAIERVDKTLGDALAEVAEAAENAAPAIRERESGAMAAVPDAAARSALSVLSAIAHVQSGTGDPAPDNVRPIRGWDAVRAWRTGKNLINKQFAKGTAMGVSGGNAVTYPLENNYLVMDIWLAAGTYTITGPATAYVYAYDAKRVVDMSITRVTGVATPYTFTLTKAAYVALSGGEAASNTYQIVRGAVAQEYAQSQSVALNAALPETVYGGTLNWVTGLLTVTHMLLTLNGTEEYWADYGAVGGFSLLVPRMKKSNGGTGWCSHLPVTSDVTRYSVVVGIDNQYLYFCQVKQAWGVTTLAELKAYLAVNPVQIVLPLATPYTIQLDPQTLPLLKGVNNVWSDTGDTAVNYIADTQLYIDGKFDELQNAILALGANI